MLHQNWSQSHRFAWKFGKLKRNHETNNIFSHFLTTFFYFQQFLGKVMTLSFSLFLMKDSIPRDILHGKEYFKYNLDTFFFLDILITTAIVSQIAKTGFLRYFLYFAFLWLQKIEKIKNNNIGTTIIDGNLMRDWNRSSEFAKSREKNVKFHVGRHFEIFGLIFGKSSYFLL